MSTRLTQQLAADVAGLTDRRLRQLEYESNPPPRHGDGSYPAGPFVEWLLRRDFARRPAAMKPYVAGYERGAGAAAHRILDDLAVLAGADEPELADLWPEAHQAPLAELRARLAALPNADEVAALLLSYVESTRASAPWEG